MPGSRSLRPRVLGAVFGGFLLIIAVFSWWFAHGSGSSYVYGPDLTKWVYGIYLIGAAVLLSGVGIVAFSGMRHLDRLIEAAEVEAENTAPAGAFTEAEHEASDALPPPLKEVPAGKDHVDQDIDELLVSLQEIESSADQAEQVVVEEVVREPVQERTVLAGPSRKSRSMEKWKKRRAEVPAFFAGPALVAVAIMGICAALLPGADAMLQSSHELNTSIILGIGYAYGGIALYAALSVYGILRRK